MSCQRCADLEEQVAYLKSELGQVEDLNVLARLRDLYGLTPHGAALVHALDRANRVVDPIRLAEAMGSGSEFSDTLRCQVLRVRKRLGRDAILNAWGRGYEIGPSGRAAVHAARAR